jgi:glycosyltransferase involved in cell wall biosynthesis
LKESGENPLVHALRCGVLPHQYPPAPEAIVFRNLQSYLAAALSNPELIRAPLHEESRRVLGVMDWRRQELARRYGAEGEDELVSIVMPTFNRARVLRTAIATVLEQTYVNWELLLVDDGGTDNTPDLVAGIDDERIRYIRLETNSGAAVARNEGLAAARGDYIAYLDSDDAWDKDFLRISLGHLRSHADINLVYSAQMIWQGEAGEGEDFQRDLETNFVKVRFAPFNRSLLENRNFMSMISILHRKSLLDEFGPFNTEMRRLIDWEFLLRLTGAGGTEALPVVLSHYHRGHVDNHISQTEDRGVAYKQLDDTLAGGQPLNAALSDHPVVEGLRLFGNMHRLSETPSSPPTSIIIPSFEALEYLALCVHSIELWTNDFELIIVDNASSAEVRTYLEKLQDSGRAKVIFNGQNLGFTHAINQGLKTADPGNDVVLLNNDALVTPGWLDALRRVANHSTDIGIAVPRQTLLAHTRTMIAHSPTCHPGREIDTTLSAHHKNVVDPHYLPARAWVELSYAPFFCVYITRDTLEQAGPLDALNGPHYRSDQLYCDVVRNFCGKKIIYTPDSKLYHFHQRSTEVLRTSAPKLFDAMHVKNDFSDIRKVGAG